MRQVIQGTAFRVLLSAAGTVPAFATDLPAGFVRLVEIDPAIRQDIRYAGFENFLHRKASGYEAPVCILTRQAAEAFPACRKRLPPRG